MRYVVLILSIVLFITTIYRLVKNRDNFLDYITPILWSLSVTIFFIFSTMKANGYNPLNMSFRFLNLWSMVNQILALIYVFVMMWIYEPRKGIRKQIDKLEKSIADEISGIK